MRARIRTVKPEMFSHEGLYDAEQETGLQLRLAWIAMPSVCDREGRFQWRPRTLKSVAMPYDAVDFEHILCAFWRLGMVRRYRVDGEDFGYVPTFLKHQVINKREAASALPEPTPENTVHFTCTHVHARGEGKGREGKGEETTLRLFLPAAAVSEDFSDSSLTNPSAETALDLAAAATNSPPLNATSRQGVSPDNTAAKGNGALGPVPDERRMPFGDPELVDALEEYKVSPAIAHGWVAQFGHDVPACEAFVHGVLLKLLSNPTKLAELEFHRKPVALYITGAVTRHIAGKPSAVMRPLMPDDPPRGADNVIPLSGQKAETPEEQIARAAREQAERRAQLDEKYSSPSPDEIQKTLARLRGQRTEAG